MNNKFFLFLTLFCLNACLVFSQDFIVLKNGSEIKSKVTDITPTEIKYKAFDNLNGPTITIEKATVFMLRYENGKTELINTLQEQKTLTNQTKVEPKLAPKVATDSNFVGNIYIGGSLPFGKYAAKNLTSEKKAGAAKFGFNSGFQIGYKIEPGFSLIAETHVSLNPYEMQVEDARYIYTLEGDWMHTFIVAGARYEHYINPKFRWYFAGTVGASFVSISGDFQETLEILNRKTKTIAFAYIPTLGFVVNKHLSLGIKYLSTSPKFSGYEPVVNKLQFTLGYELW